MTKILRASTIIGEELYVHRDADRQLRQCLEDMGRPAYVLVARQMGKTNLLLNARRELQQKTDSFVYIDLSNRLPSARECFRSIVDAVVESNEERFGSLTARIEGVRARQLPAHKEHDLELKLLLKQISGKLVIILDEIDALTMSDFSDQVFAQIRSVYFSRANVPDYERLTYVLSGVAEPTELIKNPKLSPFNIGEKIYLDDFNEEEFQEFLSRSRLLLDPEVKQSLFEWTGGNPRMTWDLCSELEDVSSFGEAVTVESVNTAVAKLYLSEFDRAPVDHIRAIAENSPEIRNALVEIRYGKGSEVSDAIRSRLYLAGIVGSSRASLKIKNLVIDRCLSDDWLRSVDRDKLSLIELASSYLSRERYVDAIQAYSEFLEQASGTAYERQLAHDGMSVAAYAVGRFEQALSVLESGGLYDRTTHQTQFFKQRLRQGFCLLHLKRYERSIECFADLLDSPDELQRLLARVNRSIAYLKSKPEEYRLEIFDALNWALGVIGGAPGWMPVGERERLLTLVRYHLSVASRQFGELQSAVEQLESSLEFASGSERVVLLSELSKVVDSPERRSELVAKCVDVIVECRLRPSLAPTAHNLELTEATFGAILVASSREIDQTAFARLVEYCVGVDMQTPVAPFLGSYMRLAASYSLDEQAQLDRVALRFLSHAEGSIELSHQIVRIFVFYGLRRADTSSLSEKYLLGLRGDARALDYLDQRVVEQLLGLAASKGSTATMDRILAAVSPHREATPKARFVTFDYYALVRAQAGGAVDEQKRVARELLNVLDTTKDLSLSVDEIEQIRSVALQAIAAPQVREWVGPKFGRNDYVVVRFSDGRVLRAKFKLVRAQLERGECSLVSDAPSHG
jgi:tetratricopeptide (TPR) repeat protein